MKKNIAKIVLGKNIYDYIQELDQKASAISHHGQFYGESEQQLYYIHYKLLNLIIRIYLDEAIGYDEGLHMRYSFYTIYDYWRKYPITNFENQMDTIKECARSLSKQSDVIARLQLINNAMNFTIKSSITARNKIEELNAAADFLKKRRFLDDPTKIKIKEAKTRMAWYRAQKKLDEADIFRARDNQKKVTALIREARILLKQDWKFAFPGEEVPKI